MGATKLEGASMKDIGHVFPCLENVRQWKHVQLWRGHQNVPTDVHAVISETQIQCD